MSSSTEIGFPARSSDCFARWAQMLRRSAKPCNHGSTTKGLAADILGPRQYCIARRMIPSRQSKLLRNWPLATATIKIWRCGCLHRWRCGIPLVGTSGQFLDSRSIAQGFEISRELEAPIEDLTTLLEDRDEYRRRVLAALDAPFTREINDGIIGLKKLAESWSDFGQLEHTFNRCCQPIPELEWEWVWEEIERLPYWEPSLYFKFHGYGVVGNRCSNGRQQRDSVAGSGHRHGSCWAGNAWSATIRASSGVGRSAFVRVRRAGSGAANQRLRT